MFHTQANEHTLKVCTEQKASQFHLASLAHSLIHSPAPLMQLSLTYNYNHHHHYRHHHCLPPSRPAQCVILRSILFLVGSLLYMANIVVPLVGTRPPSPPRTPLLNSFVICSLTASAPLDLFCHLLSHHTPLDLLCHLLTTIHDISIATPLTLTYHLAPVYILTVSTIITTTLLHAFHCHQSLYAYPHRWPRTNIMMTPFTALSTFTLHPSSLSIRSVDEPSSSSLLFVSSSSLFGSPYETDSYAQSPIRTHDCTYTRTCIHTHSHTHHVYVQFAYLLDRLSLKRKQAMAPLPNTTNRHDTYSQPQPRVMLALLISWHLGQSQHTQPPLIPWVCLSTERHWRRDKYIVLWQELQRVCMEDAATLTLASHCNCHNHNNHHHFTYYNFVSPHYHWSNYYHQQCHHKAHRPHAVLSPFYHNRHFFTITTTRCLYVDWGFYGDICFIIGWVGRCERSKEEPLLAGVRRVD